MQTMILPDRQQTDDNVLVNSQQSADATSTETTRERVYSSCANEDYHTVVPDSSSGSPRVSVYCSRDHEETYRFSTTFDALKSSLRHALMRLEIDVNLADAISQKPTGALLSEGFSFVGKTPAGKTVTVYVSLFHEQMEGYLAETQGPLERFETVFPMDGGWVVPGS